MQPDVPEAPFTSSYQGWIAHGEGYYLSRAEVSPANRQVAIEWLRDGGDEGITIAQHDGSVPGELVTGCDLAVAPHSGNLTFSPDGSQMAWKDDAGVKVAGVPSLAAGTEACTLTAPARVISTSGRLPSFGGADVAAVAGVGGGQPPAGAPSPSGGKPAGAGAGTRALKIRLAARPTRAAFAKGLTIKVVAARAGRIDASASIPAKVARRLRLRAKAGASAARIASRGFSAASAVVVARGHAGARAGQTVKLRLRPTKAAKRAARRMRKVVLTIRVSQVGAAGKARIALR